MSNITIGEPVKGKNFGDVSASRSFDTWYQNTTGSLLFVFLSGDVYKSDANITEDSVSFGLYGNISPSQTSEGAVLNKYEGARTSRDGGTSRIRIGCTLIVPDGYYYFVQSAYADDDAMFSAPSVNAWLEFEA